MLFVSPERLPLPRRGAMAIGKLPAGCGAALLQTLTRTQMLRC